ncbi:hypothetical protein [Ruegeria sp. HKCCD7255]|uniref:hypothetical protein n=1 Tax=Ruegeria sp. HKCCD7255 TaxID=2683004 RepID=UPI001487E7E9|nr:hypothetical protein [Ruegeria sp. HKCCD7255]
MKASFLSVFLSCFLACVVYAENSTPEATRSDTQVVLRCEFEDQRTILLSASDHEVTWSEKGIESPTSDLTHVRITHDPLLTVFTYGVGIGSQRLDVFQGVFHAEKPSYEVGTAILSETLVGRDKLFVRSVEGFCQTEEHN